MLYHLLYGLRDLWFGFNVFKYITFRAAMASFTAFIISIILGPIVIRKLTELKIGENIRREYVENLYELHKHKAGTPTMGGVLILFSVIMSTLLWARLDNRLVVLSMAGMALFGLVGYADDYIKLVKKRSKGLSALRKLMWQAIIAAIIAVIIYFDPNSRHTLTIPFFKKIVLNLGIFYIFFTAFVIVASCNAVNLTDGLDGLAIGCVSIITITYGIISYLTGHAQLSKYLNIYYLPGAGELTVLCAAIAGSGLGFLWFNSYPANIFMGDTGSLALGGAIGIISVLIKKEMLLFFIGAIFVAEVLSVLMQIFSLKLRGKRIFLMTPLHHHFQLKGLSESKIIIRFWIIAIIIALLTLAILKLQ